MSYMELLKEDLKRIPLLFLGFAFLSFGIVLTKRADLGMNAWGIFHQGLSVKLNLSFGLVTFLIGLVILGFSMLILKSRVGIGTVLNIAVVGLMIDLSDYLYTYIPDTTTKKIIVMLFGLVIMTFGRSLYISTRLGPGPRDGLFVGLSRIAKIDVKYIKPTIEMTVLLLGFLLGGLVGYGTVFLIITSGYMVQFFFKILHFDPKTEVQRGFSDYIFSIKKGTN